ncbi:hypothetical protein [Bacillus suaedaesalsae]|uniref:Small peptidoglycan-associated lipoprotein n=1 Tax=Bacillus suaedaesalsae TaxID=2810349 RepID=A0ABS2DJE6_9BACI|nr:hypothetical protein [Bacillus suaedaesalsae]MBM6618621.1 hypothetical protein [Bacillus suaedaesalsae]
MFIRIFVVISSFMILSSCNFGNAGEHSLESFLQADALFISNEENLEIEDEYYDAILEIKKMYPGEMNKVILITDQEHHYIEEQLEVSTYPTLLLLNEQKVKVKIEGERNTDYIFEEIVSYIEDEKQYTSNN